VAQHCGLIGPNAVAVLGSTAFWISPDKQIHSYTLGGAVRPVPCSILADFAENLEFSQADKIVATTIADHNEVWWFYPDSRDGVENSRYIALAVDGVDAGDWTRGVLARTAFCDAGPSQYPIGATYGGNYYWHERGNSADGGALNAWIETADMYLDPEYVMDAVKCWPDITGDQEGAVRMTIYGRFYPQGDVTAFGPYTITAGQDQVDIRVKARLARVRFEVNSAPGYFRLGKPMFDVRPAGKR
jgi:hypothetical protein